MRKSVSGLKTLFVMVFLSGMALVAGDKHLDGVLLISDAAFRVCWQLFSYLDFLITFLQSTLNHCLPYLPSMHAICKVPMLSKLLGYLVRDRLFNAILRIMPRQAVGLRLNHKTHHTVYSICEPLSPLILSSPPA